MLQNNTISRMGCTCDAAPAKTPKVLQAKKPFVKTPELKTPAIKEPAIKAPVVTGGGSGGLKVHAPKLGRLGHR